MRWTEEEGELLLLWKELGWSDKDIANELDRSISSVSNKYVCLTNPSYNKEAKALRDKQYRQENKEAIAKQKKQYRQENKEAKALHDKQYYQENKEAILKRHKNYRKNNKEKLSIYSKKYYKENKEDYVARNAERRAVKLNATPVWSELELIKEFYKNRPEGYHVDHIVPLQGEKVCGLHVIGNLQYLTAEENLRKGNKYE